MISIKYKKAEGSYAIFKIIGLILIVLALFGIFVFLYRAEIIQKIIDLPGFEKNNATEKIDLSTCPVLIAKISNNKIYLCKSLKCDDDPPNNQGIFLDNSILQIKYSNKFFINPEYKIGVFVSKIVIDENIVKGLGEDYFNAEPVLEYEGVNLEDLFNLNDAYLVGQTYLCKDKYANVDSYFKDVREADIFVSKFYYSLSDVLLNRKVSKTPVFTSSDLTVIKDNYYINTDSEFVYIDENGKEKIVGSMLERKYNIPESVSSPYDYGINSKGPIILDKDFKTDEKGRRYVRFIYEGFFNTKPITPWVRADYLEEYGNIGRIGDKPWVCLNNNCQIA